MWVKCCNQLYCHFQNSVLQQDNIRLHMTIINRQDMQSIQIFPWPLRSKHDWNVIGYLLFPLLPASIMGQNVEDGWKHMVIHLSAHYDIYGFHLYVKGLLFVLSTIRILNHIIFLKLKSPISLSILCLFANFNHIPHFSISLHFHCLARYK